ncbi:MAG: hypothetical protein ACLRQF_02840 [Thomasclavelia ramosa]
MGLLLKDKEEDRQEILELATAIEGHPDMWNHNFGGLTVSVMEEDNVLTLNILLNMIIGLLH